MNLAEFVSLKGMNKRNTDEPKAKPWAKAFADADGDEQKQKALYLKYRAKQLSDQSK